MDVKYKFNLVKRKKILNRFLILFINLNHLYYLNYNYNYVLKSILLF